MENGHVLAVHAIHKETGGQGGPPKKNPAHGREKIPTLRENREVDAIITYSRRGAAIGVFLLQKRAETGPKVVDQIYSCRRVGRVWWRRNKASQELGVVQETA